MPTIPDICPHKVPGELAPRPWVMEQRGTFVLIRDASGVLLIDLPIRKTREAEAIVRAVNAYGAMCSVVEAARKVSPDIYRRAAAVHGRAGDADALATALAALDASVVGGTPASIPEGCICPCHAADADEAAQCLAKNPV